MYKIAIFDLDGTLLDTLKDLADACNYALRINNYPEHEINKYKYFVGNGTYKLVERALPEDKRTEEVICKVLRDFNGYYEIHKNDSTKPYEGINDLLNKLKENGVETAVVSNKPHDFAVDIVNKYFKDKFNIVFGKRKDYPAKPDPISVLEVIDKLNATKEEVIYIGDSNVDMYTGKNAEIYTVGVAWGFRGSDELISAGADEIAYNTEELLNKII